MKCINPWSRMSVDLAVGSFCCCYANFESLARVGIQFPEEEYTEGILWKIWNSQEFIDLRKTMIENGIQDACSAGDSRCYNCVQSVYVNSSRTLSDVQQNNINEIAASFTNNQFVVSHYPQELELFLDWACNLQCPHCALHTSCVADQEHYLPVEKFSNELLEFVKHAQRLVLLGGEPTICRNYDFIMDLVRKSEGCKVFVTTNGHHIVDKILPMSDLFEGISVSIDATKAETYKIVRNSSNSKLDWTHLLYNLEHLKMMNVPHKQFNFVIYAPNYKELVDMILLGKKYGVNRIQLAEAYPDLCYDRWKQDYDFYGHLSDKDLLSDLLDKALAVGKEHGICVEYLFPSINRLGQI